MEKAESEIGKVKPPETIKDVVRMLENTKALLDLVIDVLSSSPRRSRQRPGKVKARPARAKARKARP